MLLLTIKMVSFVTFTKHKHIILCNWNDLKWSYSFFSSSAQKTNLVSIDACVVSVQQFFFLVYYSYHFAEIGAMFCCLVCQFFLHFGNHCLLLGLNCRGLCYVPHICLVVFDARCDFFLGGGYAYLVTIVFVAVMIFKCLNTCCFQYVYCSFI